jgi:hypothetical protein
VQTPDGKKIVRIDTDIGITPQMSSRERAKTVQDYFKNTFKGVPLEVGDNSVRVYKRGIKKYTSLMGTEKAKAAAELDNLLSIAEFDHHEADDGTHDFARNGWDYFNTQFEIDGEPYIGVINVALDPRGNTFYDMNQIEKSSPISRGDETPPIGSPRGELSNPNVTPPASNVNTQNLNGGNENVSTYGEGRGEVYDRGQERVYSEPDGIATEGVSERAESTATDEDGRAENQSPAVREAQREEAERTPVKYTTPAELGIPKGSKTFQVRVVAESEYTEELQALSNEARDEGYNITFVEGRIRIGRDGVRGVLLSDGSMVIQTDDANVSPTKIFFHEQFHKKVLGSKEARTLLTKLRQEIENGGGYEEYRRLVNKYYKNYVSTFNGFGFENGQRVLSRDEIDAQVADRIFEEILADAYAGVNEFGDTSKYAKLATRVSTTADRTQDGGTEDNGARAPPEVRTSFAGESAEDADRTSLTRAKELSQSGADTEAIRQETGWFKGRDGKWRFEIDDSEFSVNKAVLDDIRRDNGLAVSLGRLISNPALFKAYPQLENIKVNADVLNGENGSVWASWNGTPNISIKNTLDADETSKTLIHEIQHVLQGIEGFTSGSNVSAWERKLKRQQIWKWEPDAMEAADRLIQRAEKVSPEVRKLMNDYRNKERKSTMMMVEKSGTSDEIYEAIEKSGDAYEALMKAYGAKETAAYWTDVMKTLPTARFASELYYNTAGEIEARDSAARLGLDATERKHTPPDLGDDNTVFADDGGISEAREVESIKEQLRAAQDSLNKMKLAGHYETERIDTTKDGWKKRALPKVQEHFKRLGNKISRAGFGDVVVTERELNTAMRYIVTEE